MPEQTALKVGWQKVPESLPQSSRVEAGRKAVWQARRRSKSHPAENPELGTEDKKCYRPRKTSSL